MWNYIFVIVGFLLVSLSLVYLFGPTSGMRKSLKKRIIRLKNVKNNQRIKVNISGYVNDAICLNNYPEDKQMLVRFLFNDGKYSDSVEDYDDFTFYNFNVLNDFNKSPEDYSEELKVLLNKALDNEKYETAAVLRDAISKLSEIKQTA